MTRTLAALEFDRVLCLVAHFARTERGKKTILTGPPQFNTGAGRSRLALVKEMAALVRESGTLSFEGLDAADSLTEGADLDTRTLVLLVSLVRRIVETRRALTASRCGPLLAAVAHELPPFDGLLAHCDRCLTPAGEIPDSASVALGRARAGRERARHQIVAALEAVRREHRELTSPYTVRRERYCVPVPAAERAAVPGLVLDSSGSGATLFVEPFALVELNNALTEATAAEREEEERIIRELANAIVRHKDALLAATDSLAELDALQARVLFGAAADAVVLEPGGGDRLRLLGARHPLLDPRLAELRLEVLGEAGNRGPIVPLDLELPEGKRLLLLSGPNAGGKTVALKTVGLVALMAQAGIPAPVAAGSVLPPLSGVWCHVGDEQNLLSDLSTFTAAMGATAALLASVEENTLVLYDELGSGTDPEEGAALAAALLEELARRGGWTLATAHLTTVAAHVEQLPGAVNGAMGFDDATGRPTYQLAIGVPGRSRGLAIARRCGVLERVLDRAKELVSRGFLTIDAYLERLQQERDRLAAETETLAQARAATEVERQRASEERARLQGEVRRVRAALTDERDALRRKARTQLDAAIAELRRTAEAGELPGKRRLAAIRAEALTIDVEEPEPDAPELLPAGALVRLRGSTTTARVTRVDGDRVELAGGDTRMWVDIASCELLDPAATPPPPRITVDSVAAPEGELKLIGLTQDEARDELERFLDRALLAGVRVVRIVHGHGSGVLRRMVREALGRHPAVHAFSHPPQSRGGTGVTEAELE